MRSRSDTDGLAATLGRPRPPACRVDENACAEPSGCVFGLGCPMHNSRVHESEPGEARRNSTPDRRPCETAIEELSNYCGNDQYQKQKSVSEGLNRCPVNRAIQSCLHRRIRG